MKKLHLNICQCLVSVIFLLNHANAQKIDCDKKIDVTWKDQQIREKTYQYILFANDPKYKVPQDTLTELAVTYIDIQTNFNAIFNAMKKEKTFLTSKRTVCMKYADTLNSLLQQAVAYDNRILVNIKHKSAGFGVDDALKIVDWIWNKLATSTTWYDDLVWKDWADIVKSKGYNQSAKKDTTSSKK
jgi:hypothetical protein